MPTSRTRTGRRGPVTAVAAAVLLTACSSPARLDCVVTGIVDAGPGRDSPAYRSPEPLVAPAVALAVLALLSGADAPALPDRVTVLGTLDADDRPVRVVTGDAEAGLGVYAVREAAGAPATLVVEVPHPRADRWTEGLGVELFSALDADALLVAGAHRTAGSGSADVAHQPASAFAAVDRAIVGTGTVVVQVHGFDASWHRGSADVVLSSTDPTPGTVVEELADALEDSGFDTCVYDGERCDALAGTRNAQAAHARAVGATFVHLELAADLREAGPAREEVVEALTETLGH